MCQELENKRFRTWLSMCMLERIQVWAIFISQQSTYIGGRSFQLFSPALAWLRNKTDSEPQPPLLPASRRWAGGLIWRQSGGSETLFCHCENAAKAGTLGRVLSISPYVSKVRPLVLDAYLHSRCLSRLYSVTVVGIIFSLH